MCSGRGTPQKTHGGRSPPAPVKISSQMCAPFSEAAYSLSGGAQKATVIFWTTSLGEIQRCLSVGLSGALAKSTTIAEGDFCGASLAASCKFRHTHESPKSSSYGGFGGHLQIQFSTPVWCILRGRDVSHLLDNPIPLLTTKPMTAQVFLPRARPWAVLLPCLSRMGALSIPKRRNGAPADITRESCRRWTVGQSKEDLGRCLSCA